ncbi:MAG TPA: cytochrome c oxidase assembly protein [Solirubrobacterales bacterium]|nr:cytochrome c oxidase assembly protein [Solirubrobacterales bacterium]
MIPLAHLGGGPFEPLQVIALAAVGSAYALRALALSREGRPIPTWRLLCFAAGLSIVAAALLSPLAHLSEELLLGHMAQHLLIADIGALLIVLGLTGPLLQPLLARRWLGSLRHLAHPLVALPLWAIDLYLWHAPALYQGALGSEPLHALQHACFIGFGVLMWMPLAGPLPQPRWFGIPAKIGYLIGVRFVGTVLGNVFMWSNTIFYPDYAAGEAEWNIDPLTDQGIAGVIMTVEGGFATLGVLAWLFLLWAKQDSERQRLVDLAESRGVPLSDARAARAAAAGQGARLEERIKGSS